MKKLFDEADKNQSSYWKTINNFDLIDKKLKNPGKIVNFIKFINFLKEKIITEEPLFLIEQIVNFMKSNNIFFDQEDQKLIGILKQMADYLTKYYYNECCDNKNKINHKKESQEENKKRRRLSDSDDSEIEIDIKDSDENKINLQDEESDKESNNNDLIIKYDLKEFLDDLILLKFI